MKIINYEVLEKQLPQIQIGLKAAKPYPHCIIDNFFDPKFLSIIESNYPSFENFGDNSHPLKAQTNYFETFVPSISDIIASLKSANFLSWLRLATNINTLRTVDDSEWGSLRISKNGAELPPHVGSNKHSEKPLIRVFNLLIFLNKNWTEFNGGVFQLWDSKGKVPVVKVVPIFNRVVIFKTTIISIHNYTKVILPEDAVRKSMNIYYYAPS